MDNNALRHLEEDARELLRVAFLDDNVSSEIYIKIHDLHTSIVSLRGETTEKPLLQRLLHR